MTAGPAQTVHREPHFRAGDTVRDVVIGMSDGLTVPFALAAGISGAVAASHLVVTAGLAEIAAGSIAMGLGGFLAARGEAENYRREWRREEREVVQRPDVEAGEVVDALARYGVTARESIPVVAALRRRPEAWVDFMMRLELGLNEPHPGRALTSALTIGGSYIAGGLFPLAPYLLVPDARSALPGSVLATLGALAVFGYAKGRLTGAQPLRSAVETCVIGGIAAAAAFMLARLVA